MAKNTFQILLANTWLRGSRAKLHMVRTSSGSRLVISNITWIGKYILLVRSNVTWNQKYIGYLDLKIFWLVRSNKTWIWFSFCLVRSNMICIWKYVGWSYQTQPGFEEKDCWSDQTWPGFWFLFALSDQIWYAFENTLVGQIKYNLYVFSGQTIVVGNFHIYENT